MIPLLLNQAELVLGLFIPQRTDKSNAARGHRLTSGNSSKGNPVLSPACLWTARSAVTIPLCLGLVPKMSAAILKRPCEGALYQRELQGCSSQMLRQGEPCDRSYWGQGCTSITHLQHSEWHSELWTELHCKSPSLFSFFLQSPAPKSILCTPDFSVYLRYCC